MCAEMRPAGSSGCDITQVLLAQSRYSVPPPINSNDSSTCITLTVRYCIMLPGRLKLQFYGDIDGYGLVYPLIISLVAV